MSTPPTGSRLDTSAPDTRRESIERRILESAQALIDGGVTWNQLGIRQITERAAISRTAFYDFFASKNEVLEHLIRGLYEELSVNLREVLDPRSNGAFDLRHVRPALAAVAGYAVRHGFAYRAFLDATAEDEDLAELWDELADGYIRLTALGIEAVRATDPQAPRAADPMLVARALMLMTERTLLADVGRPPAAGMIEALADIWERAVFGTSPISGA